MLNRRGFLRATPALLSGVKEGLTRTADDRNTERDWHSFVGIFKPDAVIVTGDLWHDNLGGRGLKTLEHAVSRLEEIEVPWAFCWGNHETLYRPKVTSGTFLEEVCHEQESGQAAPVLAADDRLLACFCGHDHVNDYAVRTRQLDLVYGRATGHAGYGGEKLRKGAKLIELDLSQGTYTQVTVFADGTGDKA